MPNEPDRITVAQLRRRLASYNDDDELYFSGLTFYRLKRRGEDLVQVEFYEYQVENNEEVIVFGKVPNANP
jgi:hypothetical protein